MESIGILLKADHRGLSVFLVNVQHIKGDAGANERRDGLRVDRSVAALRSSSIFRGGWRNCGSWSRSAMAPRSRGGIRSMAVRQRG